MRISDWSSDVCSSDLHPNAHNECEDDGSEVGHDAAIPAEVFRMVGEALHSRDTQHEPPRATVVPVVTTVMPNRHAPQQSSPSVNAMFAPLLARLLPMPEVWQQ